jgi:hypothetical protein
VAIVGGVFLACLGAVLCAEVRSMLASGGATVGPPDPVPSAKEKPCYLYVTEGNVLGLAPSLQFIPTFTTRDALLAYADARLAGNAPASVDSLKGLASLEKRGARADVAWFDLVSMQIVGSKGRAWIHPTWCQEAAPR